MIIDQNRSKFCKKLEKKEEDGLGKKGRREVWLSSYTHGIHEICSF